MPNYLSDLIEISHFYGQNKDFIISGGGNTSLKDGGLLYIKGSGFALGNIDERGFVAMDREKLSTLLDRQYSVEPFQREHEVKTALGACRAFTEKGGRPSVETSLHDMINYRFIVHTHPFVVNSVLCSALAHKTIKLLFEAEPTEPLYIEYTDPGYILAKKIKTELIHYRQTHQVDPQIIFLENHGIFVGADTTEEIKQIYNRLISIISSRFKEQLKILDLPMNSRVEEIQRMLSNEILAAGFKETPPELVTLIHNNNLIQFFAGSQDQYDLIGTPFTPDIVVYCKGAPVYLVLSEKISDFQADLRQKLVDYKIKWGYRPKIFIIKGLGMVAVDDTEKSTLDALEMYEDCLKIGFYSQNFGGPHGLTPREINFIDTWEVENYRRQIAKAGKK